MRDVFQQKEARPLDPLDAANAARPRLEWRPDDVVAPAFLGRRVVDDVTVDALVPYIDWRFFFTAWELPGRFPAVLEDPTYGDAARDLYRAAQALLDRIVREGLLRARGVYGFWPAASAGNDIVLYTDATRSAELARFPMLRQQGRTGGDAPHWCLADFVAPVESGLADHVGAFAVTTGLGIDELVARYVAEHDDYHAIMVKALADRLAEAFAEYLHERARREWYAPEERLELEGLLKERFHGIRPAFGYPACPDHTPKTTLFRLLDAPAVGITLTESMAMLPAASVSGLYLAHPESRYFAVGRIGRDQVEDYARRTGASVAVVERWLAPNLGYDPKAPGAAAA
jgi:5-methyltetrahydrofolate--homocysteine methyltransferase